MYIRQRAVSPNGSSTATFAKTPLQGSLLYAWVVRRNAGAVSVSGFHATFTDSVFGAHIANLFDRTAGAAEPTAVAASGSNNRVVAWEIAEWNVGGGGPFGIGRGGAVVAGGSVRIGIWPGLDGPFRPGSIMVLGAAWDHGDADADGTATPDGGLLEYIDLTGADGTVGHGPHVWAADMTFVPPIAPTQGVTMNGAFPHAHASIIIEPAPGRINSAPRGLSGAPEYVIELYDSSGTFGPNNKIGEVWDARNIGWSRYDRLPGKAFFTLYQDSPVLPLLTQLLTHIAIWRITPNGDTLVYRGVYIDSNNTGDDVIVECYDYKSLLSISRSGFKTLYPTKLLGTEIVAPEWAAARGAASSPLGFITTGTIEDPLDVLGTTPIKTNAQFGTLDQSRLQLFYDLTEMGRANTANQVTFDIDLLNQFHFYKNRGSAVGMALVLGGNISDYGYVPGGKRYRNDVATVGVASGGGSSEIVSTNPAEITAKGLRQDVTTLKTLAGIAGGATEADQQKAALERELKHLIQQQSSLMLRAERGKIEPFVGYEINDIVRVELSNGNDSITGTRRILGLRCLFSEPGEDVDLLVAQVAT